METGGIPTHTNTTPLAHRFQTPPGLKTPEQHEPSDRVSLGATPKAPELTPVARADAAPSTSGWRKAGLVGTGLISLAGVLGTGGTAMAAGRGFAPPARQNFQVQTFRGQTAQALPHPGIVNQGFANQRRFTVPANNFPAVQQQRTFTGNNFQGAQQRIVPQNNFQGVQQQRATGNNFQGGQQRIVPQGNFQGVQQQRAFPGTQWQQRVQPQTNQQIQQRQGFQQGQVQQGRLPAGHFATSPGGNQASWPAMRVRAGGRDFQVPQGGWVTPAHQRYPNLRTGVFQRGGPVNRFEVVSARNFYGERWGNDWAQQPWGFYAGTDFWLGVTIGENLADYNLYAQPLYVISPVDGSMIGQLQPPMGQSSFSDQTQGQLSILRTMAYPADQSDPSAGLYRGANQGQNAFDPFNPGGKISPEEAFNRLRRGDQVEFRAPRSDFQELDGLDDLNIYLYSREPMSQAPQQMQVQDQVDPNQGYQGYYPNQ